MRDYRNEEELKRDAALAAPPALPARLRSAWVGARETLAEKAAALQSALQARALRFQGPRLQRRHTGTIVTKTDNFSADFSTGTAIYGDGLSGELWKSAERAKARSVKIGALANDLRDALSRRDQADELLLAQALRMVLGVIAVLAAARLFIRPLSGSESGVAMAGLTAAAAGDPAAQLSRLLLILGGVAIAAALLRVLMAIWRLGQGPYIAAASVLGRQVSTELGAFDDRLMEHRRRLGDASLSNDQVMREVSAAHVTAREAITLFDDLDFLVDAPDAKGANFDNAALDKFQDFIERRPPPALSELTSIAFGNGFAAGAGVVSVFLLALIGFIGPQLTLPETALSRESGLVEALRQLATHPSVLASVCLGFLVFFAAGGLAGTVAPALFRGPRRTRRRRALSSLRGALTGENAPRARDIVQRVEDLSEIFRARLTRAGQLGGAPPSAGALAADDIPTWRKGPEGPRFVDVGFTAAPKPFLADLQGGKNRANGAQRSASKRSLFNFEKRPGVKS